MNDAQERRDLVREQQEIVSQRAGEGLSPEKKGSKKRSHEQEE